MTRTSGYIAVFLVALLALAGCGGSGSQPGSNEAGGTAMGRGQVINANKAAGTFTIKPLVEWQGFVPQGDGVDVATDSGTKFFDRGGNQVSSSAWFDYVIMNLS